LKQGSPNGHQATTLSTISVAPEQAALQLAVKHTRHVIPATEYCTASTLRKSRSVVRTEVAVSNILHRFYFPVFFSKRKAEHKWQLHVMMDITARKTRRGRHIVVQT
jgi:hypothetical protein